MFAPTTLPICVTGDPVLYQIAAPVTEFDARLEALAHSAMVTMDAAKGVGIAAPQIGVSLRFFIVASRANERYPDAPDMAPVVMVNPSILAASNELVAGEEGCLSVPGKRLSILRHQWLDVSWQSLDGETHHARLEGFVARIFQHELDHLDGITLLERIERQHKEPVPS